MYAAIERYPNDEHNVEPVDVLIPVLPRNGKLCDVWLLWVIGFVAVWLALLGHWRGLGGKVLRLDGLVADNSL